jgi:cytochrome c-type biogenesis protein CcmH
VAALLAGLLLAGCLLLCPAPVSAQSATGTQREAQEIARTLKCPVCESQSVADSPSQLAQEMRAYIERRLEAGESRDAILADLVDRYGEGILLEPPRQGFTLIVWWLPILSLAVGALVVALTLRRATRAPSDAAGGVVPAGSTGRSDAVIGPTRGEAAVEPLPELAPDELAHYRARLADELARSDRNPA